MNRKAARDASYQLPATSYQLPATSYQLPATSYQLPATSYQLPATSYQGIEPRRREGRKEPQVVSDQSPAASGSAPSTTALLAISRHARSRCQHLRAGSHFQLAADRWRLFFPLRPSRLRGSIPGWRLAAGGWRLAAGDRWLTATPPRYPARGPRS
ncbi:hypothetical protein CKO17_13215 [Marichromatium gracile]|nr:hypothetical protein [Marichromatium gracile]